MIFNTGISLILTRKVYFLPYVDTVCLTWCADTMPVKQPHDHHVRRILQVRLINRGEGNGKLSQDMT